jgi:hypothetical protein
MDCVDTTVTASRAAGLPDGLVSWSRRHVIARSPTQEGILRMRDLFIGSWMLRSFIRLNSGRRVSNHTPQRASR